MEPQPTGGSKVPYKDPLTADTVLVRGAIQSPNYVPGVSGWIVRQNGSAEFQNLIARGTIVANQIKTSDVQTDPRLWINNPAYGVDGPNSIVLFKEDQNDATPFKQLARVTANKFSGQNPGLILSPWGESGDVDLVEMQLVAGTPGTGAGAVIQLASPDAVAIFSGGQTNGENGLTNNTFPVLDTHNFQLLGPAMCNNNTALTTANQSIPGTDITFTTVNPGAIVVCLGQFDMNCSTAIGAGGVSVGTFQVDGVDSGNPLAISDAQTANRQGCSTTLIQALGAAGSHTIRLRARKTINAGAVTALISQTALSVLVFDFG
jgi:hypothetical protein